MRFHEPHSHPGWALLLSFFILPGTCPGADSCDPVRTFADGKTPLREIFVSPNADSPNADGTRAKPFRTIGQPVQGVRAGDAIRLLPGEHAGGTFIGNFAGTSDAPIWLGGEPGQPRPVIRGGSNGIQISRARYLVLENMEISGATGNGINCDDGADYANTNATRNLLFRNLFIHDIGTGGNQDGLKLSGVNDYFVLDCEFARVSAGGSGIDHVGCHRGLIARCSFTDLGNSIQCKGGSEDIEIRWNRFVNGGGRAVNMGGSTGFTFFRPPLSTTAPNFEAKNIRVLANLFRGSDAPVAFVGAVQSLVANNTIFEPTRWIMRILQETTSSDGYTFLPSGENRFINNLVVFKRAQISAHVNIGANTAPASFEFAHNFWFASDQPNQSRPTLPSAETNGLYGLNPGFRDIATGDFSVSEDSPAARKGTKLPGLAADLLERCYANPPTIGAFEANTPARADADGDSMPDHWEDANALNKHDPTDAALDPDGDALNNLGEYLAETDPNNARSVFALNGAQLAQGRFSFRFSSALGRTYHLESRDLIASNWTRLPATNGTGMDLTFQEELAVARGKVFRVQVSE